MVSLRLSRRAASVLASKGYVTLAIGYPRMFLFGGNVAVEDLDDAVEIGNQYPDLRRFSQCTLVFIPTVFHFRAPMTCFGTLEDPSAP
jgi:hypothetical protein